MRPYLVSAPLRRQQSLVINSLSFSSSSSSIYLITSHCNGAPPKDPRQSGSVPTRPELHHVAPLFGVPTWKCVLFSFSGSYLMLLIRWVERGNEMKCDLSPSKLRPTTITHSKLKLPALFLKRLGSSRALFTSSRCYRHGHATVVPSYPCLPTRLAANEWAMNGRHDPVSLSLPRTWRPKRQPLRRLSCSLSQTEGAETDSRASAENGASRGG